MMVISYIGTLTRFLAGPGHSAFPSSVHLTSFSGNFKVTDWTLLQFQYFQTLYLRSIIEIKAKCESKSRNKSTPFSPPSQFVRENEGFGPVPPAASNLGISLSQKCKVTGGPGWQRARDPIRRWELGLQCLFLQP